MEPDRFHSAGYPSPVIRRDRGTCPCRSAPYRHGNVTIDVNISSRADDLVAVLEIRAGKIKRYIEERYKERSSDFIAQFERIHREHINQLKVGNFVAAHELLAEIHKLSFMVELEKKEGF